MENEVEMVAVDLPEEVVGEILLRLPVKSLLKFRCVSKSWLSLISTHQFSMAHLNISTKKNDTLIFGSNVKKNLCTCSVSSVSELTTDILYPVDNENPVYDELDCPFSGMDKYRRIVGSCNGLVCLSFTGGFLLWNPALKKYKKLPYSSTHYGYHRLGNSHGFGYDKVHDDYKVVEFSNPDQVKVYSRRSNSWKYLTNWPGGIVLHCLGQFLNGAIHWPVWDQGWFIVAQDIVFNEFVKLPLPSFEESSSLFEVEVNILDGCVALCCFYKTHMDVWVMKEYGLGESWIKKACIPCSPHSYRLQPLLFFGDGKILIKYGKTLRIYDSTNPQLHQLPDMNMDLEEITITSYFESLVSPNLDKDVSSFTEIAAIQEI